MSDVATAVEMEREIQCIKMASKNVGQKVCKALWASTRLDRVEFLDSKGQKYGWITLHPPSKPRLQFPQKHHQ